MRLIARFQLMFLLCLLFFLGVVKITASVNESVDDLVMHFLAYMVLMCSGLFAFPHRMYTAKLFSVFLTYSIFIECIQYFLPYRSFALLDIFANSAGLLVGISLSLFLLPLFKYVHAYGR
ncbi:MAG: VanZ family protein [Cellvibrionaceae bacterium]|jgi:VanZ family protein